MSPEIIELIQSILAEQDKEQREHNNNLELEYLYYYDYLRDPDE